MDRELLLKSLQSYHPVSEIKPIPVKLRRAKLRDFRKHLVCLTPEVGYAFFLGRNLTVEPAVYYDLSLDETSQYSKLGFKIGFGLYF